MHLRDIHSIFCLFIFLLFFCVFCIGPEKPVDLIITSLGTDNLCINWTLPKGSVDHYVVKISNTVLIYMNSKTRTVTTACFTDLYPGRVFVITVTSVAGSFTCESDPSSFATRKFNILYCCSFSRCLLEQIC